MPAINNYVGYHTWFPTDAEWADFIVKPYTPEQLLENEYLLVFSEQEKNKKFSYSQYCFENGSLRKVPRGSITYKGPENKNITVNPHNSEQSCAIDLLQDPNKTVKLITGRWGSGKTMLLVTAALEALKQGRFDQIVWLRNNVDVANTKDLGALPGEVNDKLLPFLGPFIDHTSKAQVECMLSNGHLIIEPLQSLRGRNFKNTLIMCSEAENLTKSHLQLIIARAAEGSEIWLDADIKQRDKAVFEKERGIETMIERLAGQKLFGYINLKYCERSETAAMADLLD